VTVVDGYGLTESAPVIGVRPVFGGVKRTMTLLEGTEAKILDEAGRAVEPGEKGTLYVRGPQVMDGYFKRPDLTAEVLSEDGWLNTGDLAMWTHHGEFAIVGRAKDTIVLSGGENLEPLPIEAKLAESEFIERAVVLGQDQRFLGALIVINADRITQYLEEQRIPFLRDSISEMQEVRKLIGEEISSLINEKQGFKSYEQIVRFHLLAERFEVGKQLSAKEEVRRFAIQELYTVEIASLFAS
ncbi:MAG TPA: AMP-binding protein, partial [Sphaerochaeta sp.]|nr:AMP-binding protein [Sphaerochaeta sp.]